MTVPVGCRILILVGPPPLRRRYDDQGGRFVAYFSFEKVHQVRLPRAGTPVIGRATSPPSFCLISICLRTRLSFSSPTCDPSSVRLTSGVNVPFQWCVPLLFHIRDAISFSIRRRLRRCALAPSTPDLFSCVFSFSSV